MTPFSKYNLYEHYKAYASLFVKFSYLVVTDPVMPFSGTLHVISPPFNIITHVL